MASALSKKVLSCTMSEEFDLANFNDEATVLEFVTKTFKEVFLLSEMIRFTFLVGGGKLSRAKYSESLPKWLSSALKEIGFSEDRGASCVISSCGTYKQQHDTGKNLIYVHVFPRVEILKSKKGEADELSAFTSSIEFLAAKYPISDFKEQVLNKTLSYTQKESLNGALKEMLERVEKLNAKVISDYAAVLSEVDKVILESLTSDLINEKIAIVKEEIQKHLSEGKLTAEEIKILTSDIEQKIQKVNEELSKPENTSKPKLLEKLNALLIKETSKMEKVKGFKGIVYGVERAAEIYSLKAQLEMIEKKSHQILTLDEIKKLPKKDEVEKELNKLLKRGICYFESQEQFEARLLASKPKTKVSTKAGSAPAVNKDGWTTVSTKATAAKPKETRKKNIGGGFGALSLDDSDED